MFKNEIPTEPEEVGPIAPEEFRFALEVGVAAGSFQMPMESPSKYHFAIKDEDGAVDEYQFTDTPMNRFGMAVKEHFGADRLKMASFMLRWFAFHKVVELPACAPYIRETAEGRSIHSSVMDTAAQHPLNREWEFDETTFFKRVAELYAIDPN